MSICLLTLCALSLTGVGSEDLEIHDIIPSKRNKVGTINIENSIDMLIDMVIEVNDVPERGTKRSFFQMGYDIDNNACQYPKLYINNKDRKRPYIEAVPKGVQGINSYRFEYPAEYRLIYHYFLNAKRRGMFSVWYNTDINAENNEYQVRDQETVGKTFTDTEIPVYVSGPDDEPAENSVVIKRLSITLDPFKNSRFFVAPSPSSRSFEAAEEMCASMSATLASINSEEEMFEASTICQTESRPDCLIGIKRVGETEWENSDGTLPEYGFNFDGSATTAMMPWTCGDVSGRNPIPEPYSGFNENGKNYLVLNGGFIWEETAKSGDFPLCRKDTNGYVRVKSCEGWTYGSMSNSLHMQLRGETGSTALFSVNEFSELPINGESKLFDLPLKDYDIGEVYSVIISMNDPKGTCIQELSIDMNGQGDLYEFTPTEYFGSGIILSKKCKYSFQSVTQSAPLIMCKDGSFELNSFETRNIYELDIHTCMVEESGISIQNMKHNVYAVIMGKVANENAYITTKTIDLDHYLAGHINFATIGHLIATAVKLTYTYQTILRSNIVGTIVGVKFEWIEGSRSNARISTLHIGDKDVMFNKIKSFENGKYAIAFEKQQIDQSTTIGIITSGDTAKLANVYVIMADKSYNDLYQLPFVFVESDDAVTWEQANQICQDEYGTTLSSIHSEEEHWLMTGFAPHSFTANSWVGMKDVSHQMRWGQGRVSEWQWVDGSTTDWGELREQKTDADAANHKPRDCAVLDSVKYWKDYECDANDVKSFFCATTHWTPDTHRIFEFNVVETMNEITLVSVDNNNKENDMCIDSIAVDGLISSHIEDIWIGGSHTMSKLNAIFKYPVCKTEVIGVTIEYDSEQTKAVPEDAKISGLNCINNNRLISSTCSISQSYELSKVTSFAISNGNEATTEYSWGRESSFTTGTSTSNEFSFGAEVGGSVTVGATVSAGLDANFVAATAEVSISASANTQWTDTTERSSERSSSKNEGRSVGSASSNGQEASWETSETSTIECSAEIEVPASHSIQYSLILHALNTTIKTKTDLKLTLCSAFVNPLAKKDDESHYIYIDNIPGYIHHKETTSCNVEFEPAKYIRNDVDCQTELQLAISSNAQHVPRCRETNPKEYDGCQCNLADLEALGVCWCVDFKGNPLPGKGIYVPNEADWEDTCVDVLKCENSEVSAVSWFDILTLSIVLKVSLVWFIIVVVVIWYLRKKRKVVADRKVVEHLTECDVDLDEEEPLMNKHVQK